MKETSGLEMIQALLQQMDLLQKKVDLVDLNIKRLMNEGRAKPKVTAAEAPKAVPKNGIRNFKFEATKKTGACMCVGKMVVNNGGKSKFLGGLSVRIFNEKNKEVKSTRTNMGGEWRSLLPVGRYCALIEGKFGGRDLYPVNMVFEVLPGVKEMEVK